MGNKKQIGTLLATLMALALGACAKENPIYCGDDKPCPTGLYCSTEHICAAGFSLDETGYYFDGKTYWSAISAPVLTGTTNIPSPMIEVYAGDVLVAGPATVDGDTWSLPLPEGTLKDNTPTELRVVQTDENQRHVEITRTFAGDLAPPTAEFIPTDSLDESKDTVEFEGDGTPRHTHEQYKITLDGRDTKELPRYQHLLRVGSPYARENAPNPAMWQIALNTRVAFDKAATRYRITGAEGPIVDWAPIVPVAQQSGGYQFSVPISLETAAVFGAKSGTYTIEFEVTDWAKRQVKQSATWSIKLLPPPLQVGPYTISQTPPHSLQNWLLSAGSPLAGLINGQVPVQLFERIFYNGVDQAVEITVTVTANFARAEAQARSFDVFEDRATNEACVGAWLSSEDAEASIENQGSDLPNLPPPSQVATNPTLNWTVSLRDSANTLIARCRPTAAAFACLLPGRAPNESPVALRVVAELASLPELNAVGGSVSDFDGLSGRITNYEPNRCHHIRTNYRGGKWCAACTTERTTTRFKVLSGASLVVYNTEGFGDLHFKYAPDIKVKVAVPDEIPATQAAPLVMTGNNTIGAEYSWNAGSLPRFNP